MDSANYFGLSCALSPVGRDKRGNAESESRQKSRKIKWYTEQQQDQEGLLAAWQESLLGQDQQQGQEQEQLGRNQQERRVVARLEGDPDTRVGQPKGGVPWRTKDK